MVCKILKSKYNYRQSCTPERCTTCENSNIVYMANNGRVWNRYECPIMENKVSNYYVCNEYKLKVEIKENVKVVKKAKKSKKKLSDTKKNTYQRVYNSMLYENAKETLKYNNDVNAEINKRCYCFNEYVYEGSEKSDKLVIKKGTNLYFRITEAKEGKNLLFKSKKHGTKNKLFFLIGLRLNEFNKHFTEL